jgi:uncharacterized cupredoxin-like copper-binding protein
VLHVVASLSTGHKIGLAVVAAVFIVFALSASFLAPRRWPDFPGQHGLSVFIIASFVVFAAMLAAVLVFGRESSEAKGAEVAQGSPARQTIEVKETEFRIQLPALSELKQGEYTFHVTNAGKVPHNLVIEGPRAAGEESTPTIKPGGDATLKVALGVGNYTLYCSIPGHRKLGMQARISVG